MEREPTRYDVDTLVGPATPQFAYQLRARVREQTAASCREPVTMSFGVCEAAPGEGATDVVRRTDNALYAAKAAGRNLVSPWRAALPRSASAA